MAHMIPRQILQKVTYGEQKVFDLLKNTPGSKDWYVLHSLNLPPLLSRTILSGSVVSMPAVFEPNTGAPSKDPLSFASEIDFLVIAPQLGIFCLEVKSGEVKRDKDGIWIVSDKSGQSYPSSTGPFSQAENAMHKIINIVKKNVLNIVKTICILVLERSVAVYVVYHNITQTAIV